MVSQWHYKPRSTYYRSGNSLYPELLPISRTIVLILKERNSLTSECIRLCLIFEDIKGSNNVIQKSLTHVSCLISERINGPLVFMLSNIDKKMLVCLLWT